MGISDLAALTVTGDGWRRICVSFARQVAESPQASWCAVCVDVLSVTGAGLTLSSADAGGPLCASNDDVVALEELAFATGDSPGHDAHRDRRVVHAARLEADATSRWPAFIEEAETRGIRAVFAYPLCADGENVGVLTIYNDADGELSSSQDADCAALAEIFAATIVSLQGDAPDGELAASLDDAAAYRAELYQASGVVAVQLSIAPAEAVDRIRAHCFATGEALATISADILAHRLWLPDDRQTAHDEV